MDVVTAQLRGEGHDVTSHQGDISDHAAFAELADASSRPTR
ncbi:hypothetical protein IRJ34_09915 [Paenarthrobacter sp. GOM3]|nr:hypothetical protein [Paenarthrobacter sp. GOM3]WOH20610.1 hypothetical protein IRJ34_09915 [Paenarthrobacter sp. GOM3]